MQYRSIPRLNTDAETKGMGKKALAIKVDDTEADSLKQTALASGKSVTRVLMDGAEAHKENLKLRAELQDLRRMYEDLANQFKTQTGQKVKTVKRVSIPLTAAEFDAVRKAAYEQGASNSQTLKAALQRQYLPSIMTLPTERPALQIVDSKL